MEYTVVIRKAPDGVFIGSCPVIPEVHTQGKNYKKCLVNLKEAIELALECRKEQGEEIPIEIGTEKVNIAV
jgi:antitoxin HicB